MRERLVLLGGERDSTWIVANRLRAVLGDFPVVLEEAVPRSRIVRRRVRTLGWRTTAGQTLFALAAAPALRLRSAARIAEIEREHGMDPAPFARNVHRVRSANGKSAIRLLQQLAPDLVVVNGTRILSKAVLAAIPGRFLNTHAGVTPAFRGSHGAYWALAAGRPDLAGTTVHWVDSGIDTGGALKQARIAPGPRDNFATYPYLQLAAGLPLLTAAVREYLDRGAVTEDVLPNRADPGSKLYHHPTLWGYLAGRLRGIR